MLDQLCAPLCDAVLGEPGAQEQLRRPRGVELVPGPARPPAGVVPLPRACSASSCSASCAGSSPTSSRKLHLRAADWYEANGSPALAVEHLLNTAERDRCVQLVTALVLPTYQAGQISTVQRWLVGARRRRHRGVPPAGGARRLDRGVDRADRRGASGGRRSSTPRRSTWCRADGSASFDSARAMLRAVMCAAGPEQMLADASFAVAQEPPWSPWRDTALCMLRRGAPARRRRRPGARAVLARRPPSAAAIGNTDTVVDARGRARRAGDGSRAAGRRRPSTSTAALAAIDEHRMHDYATSVLAFAGAARLAVHRGDLDEAERQLTRAMRARPSCTFALPYLAVRVRLQLAKVYWALGDQTTARHLLREIDDVLLHRPALGTLVDEVAELRARSSSASAPTGATGASPLTPAELRLLPYLQTHLTIREIAERLFVSRNTVSSQVGSIYRKLGVSSRERGGAAGDGDRPARRLSAGVTRRIAAPSVVGVVAERQRQLRGRRDDAGQPDDGTTPTSTSTISAAVAPALDRGVGLRRRRTGPRRRRRPARPGGPAPASSDRARADSTASGRGVTPASAASLMASRRNRSV